MRLFLDIECDAISAEADHYHGDLVVSGSRYPVAHLLAELADGRSVRELAEDHGHELELLIDILDKLALAFVKRPVIHAVVPAPYQKGDCQIMCMGLQTSAAWDPEQSRDNRHPDKKGVWIAATHSPAVYYFHYTHGRGYVTCEHCLREIRDREADGEAVPL